MKNDPVSFKLVAVVIIAGVIAAFLDNASSAKAAPSAAHLAAAAPAAHAAEAAQ